MKSKSDLKDISYSILKKLLMVLRIAIFAFVATVSSVFATSSYSQEAKVTIKLENASLEQVLNEIENQSEFHFLFNQKQIDIQRKVSINVKNTLIEKILIELFSGSNINYRIINKQILLSTDPIPQETQQSNRITGKITDGISGLMLIGVNIIIEGTTTGTISDLNGAYSIEVPDPNAVLLFSYIGYSTLRVELAGRTSFDVLLISDAKSLDEVVVTGYGTVKKRDLTGAISSVRSKDIVATGNASIGQLLGGRAAGMQVTQNSAQPGGGMEFLIRGANAGGAGNQPLIVVDGFPLNMNFEEAKDQNRAGYGDYGSRSPLNSIDPNDIESVEVLKDASSTAIYGARAGHGVILITTKRGKTEKSKISYSGSVSFQNISDDYNVLNAKDFMLQTNRYEKESWLVDPEKLTNKRWGLGLGIYGPDGKGLSEEEYLATPGAKPYVPIYSDRQIDSIPGTDWASRVIRPGKIIQHNLSLSGGSDATKYMVSFGIFDQTGVISNSDLKRYTGRINLDQKVSNKINVGVNLSFSQIYSANAAIGTNGTDENGNPVLAMNSNSGLIRSAIQFDPTLPLKDENGEYSIMPSQPTWPNPETLKELIDDTNTGKITANSFIDYEAFKNFKIRLNTGADRNISKRQAYVPMTVPLGKSVGGRATAWDNQSQDYLVELTGSYVYSRGVHNLNILGGYSWQISKSNESYRTQNRFISDALGVYNLGTGDELIVASETGSKEEMASYFARANYILKDKYLLTATIRADGSSKFGANNKWGYFPSVALAWKLDNEPFMNSISSVVSTLKPRVSYGQTGNSNIGGNAFPYYWVNTSGFQINKDPMYAKGMELGQLENPDLRWETTSEYNIGLDFGFLKDRISGSVEYYSRIISDLLAQRSLMSYHSLNTLWYNVGKTQSKGLELTINTRNISNVNFFWTTDLTFFRNVDRWKEHDPSWKPMAYESETDYRRPYDTNLSGGLVKPGEVIPHMPLALSGVIKILDVNGYTGTVDESGKQLLTGAPDGKLDGADVVRNGTTDNKFSMGLNNTFSYKMFTLNIYMYGVFGKRMYNPLYDSFLQSNTNKDGFNKIGEVKQSYANDNQGSAFPSYFLVSTPVGTDWGWGDYFMEDASYVRVKNITLFCQLKPKWLFNVVREASVYLDFQNPFIITKYSGIDPETDTYQAAYPNQKTTSIGIKVAF